MNNLMAISKMTSMEIAEITGKRHDHILRDINDEIEKLQNAGIDTAPKFGLREREGLTGTIPYYELTKEGVLQLAARYDAVTRSKLIDVAMKSEQPMTPQLLIASALIEAQKMLDQKDEQIQIMKPKAEFFDAVANSKDAIEIGQAAKVLNFGKGRNTLFTILRQEKILRDNNEPYQEYIDRGYFRMIEQKYTKPGGETCISIKTLVYQRGLSYIKKILDERKTGQLSMQI